MCSLIGHNNAKHFFVPNQEKWEMEMVRWESVPRGSFARTWKLSTRLFSRPDWMPPGSPRMRRLQFVRRFVLPGKMLSLRENISFQQISESVGLWGVTYCKSCIVLHGTQEWIKFLGVAQRFRLFYSLYIRKIQRAKKVVSDSPGLVDCAIVLVIFVLNLPNRRVLFFGEIQITEGW